MMIQQQNLILKARKEYQNYQFQMKFMQSIIISNLVFLFMYLVMARQKYGMFVKKVSSLIKHMTIMIDLVNINSWIIQTMYQVQTIQHNLYKWKVDYNNYYYYYVLLSEGTNQINQFLPNVTSFFFSSRVSAVTEPTLLANLPPSLCSSHGSASYFIHSVFAERTPISFLTFLKLALILLSSLEFCYHQYRTHSSKSSQEACRETKGIRLHQSHPTGFGVKFKGHSWMSPSSEILILTDFSP
ncbi:hypothetical protein pb186bvf_020942 [Paramecium bursaria]